MQAITTALATHTDAYSSIGLLGTDVRLYAPEVAGSGWRMIDWCTWLRLQLRWATDAPA